MAKGDVYTLAMTDVADTSFVDLRPTAGVEIVIHNISHANSAELYHSDGTTNILVDSQTGNDTFDLRFYHATNSLYYRVKNVSGGTMKVCADGMTTK